MQDVHESSVITHPALVLDVAWLESPKLALEYSLVKVNLLHIQALKLKYVAFISEFDPNITCKLLRKVTI